MRRKLSAIAPMLKPFDIGFDHAVSYPNQNDKAPVVLACEVQNPEFNKLQQLAQFALDGLLKPSLHLTVAWAKERIAKEMINPIGWRAGSMALIRSFVGETRYEEIGRWDFGR